MMRIAQRIEQVVGKAQEEMIKKLNTLTIPGLVKVAKDQRYNDPVRHLALQKIEEKIDNGSMDAEDAEHILTLIPQRCVK